jgi:hypothetical protein
MPIDFAASAADYKSILIELRDDVQRLKGSSTIASLATVMGPAVQAGMQETSALEAKLQGDTMLTQLLADQSPLLYNRVIELTQEHCETDRIRVLANATALADEGFVQPQSSMVAKTELTVNKLEAKSKELLNEAEAKANIISRKRADILSVFDSSMLVVTEQSKRIQAFDNKMAELATELAANMSSEHLSTDEMCTQILKISTAQKAFGSQKEIALKAIMEHFGEAMTLGRSKSTDLVALTIPENIEAGKGTALMENLTLYLAGRSDHYYALMPYVQRILSDYDPISGMCYKPPDIHEGISDIPVEIRGAYAAQAKTLYNMLISKLTANVKRLVKSTFQYGVNEESALCSEYDGPMALFALICMFRPCTLEYTEKIESALYDAHKGFNGQNLRKHIKSLRAVLLEAQELAIELKWKQSGKPIVDIMTHKDHNMSDALSAFKNAVISDKNSLAQLDKLFAAIESQCKRDEQHDDKHGGNTKKHANSAYGKGAPDSGMRGECRFGARCTRDNCFFTHPGTEISTSKGKGDGKKDKGKGKGNCKAKGCSKPCGEPNHLGVAKSVCKDCFKLAISDRDKGVMLKDGTHFKAPPLSNQKNDSVNLSKGQKKTFKKALQAYADSAKNDADDQEFEEWDGDMTQTEDKPGPLSSKRRVKYEADTKTHDGAKKPKGDSQIKAFAAAMGFKLH